MDRCRCSSSALLLLILLLLVVSDLAKAEDKVSPPPAPAPPSKNESSGAAEKPLDRKGSSDGSLNSSSVAAPPGNPVGMPPPMQVSGNSSVPPPMPSSKGTLQPPSPPQNNSSEPVHGSRSEPPTNAEKSGDKGKKDGEAGKCGKAATRCWDSLVTCLWRPSNDTKKVILILQNEGENNITVIARILPSGNIITNKTLVKKGIGKIPIPIPAKANDLKIVLNAGGPKCTVKMADAHVPNIFQHFPTYATRVTPMYGVYAILLTVLIVGGTWACCKFTGLGSRADAGVPYQQLEMGVQTQSTSVTEADATRGWDQWDDDWDEEEAASRPSQKRHGGGAPANGDATTTSSKDGWEDWND